MFHEGPYLKNLSQDLPGHHARRLYEVVRACPVRLSGRCFQCFWWMVRGRGCWTVAPGPGNDESRLDLVWSEAASRGTPADLPHGPPSASSLSFPSCQTRWVGWKCSEDNDSGMAP